MPIPAASTDETRASTDPSTTAARLGWTALAQEVADLLRDPTVVVPPRQVLALPGGASLFVMAAHDAQVAIVKVISYQPNNLGTARATIQGDVLVCDIATGTRRLQPRSGSWTRPSVPSSGGLARRKPQRWPVPSRGFATPPARPRATRSGA